MGRRRTIADIYAAHRAAIIAIVMVMVGCAAAPPVEEVVTFKGSIQASDDVNPDASGRPSPIRIKIFQLAARNKFEDAGYFSLLDDAEATLGGELLGVETIMLMPGEQKVFEGEFDPGIRFVGVIGGYRDIDNAKWRSLIEMPEQDLIKFLQDNRLLIQAERESLSISADK